VLLIGLSQCPCPFSGLVARLYGMGVGTLCQTALGEVGSGCLNPVLSWCAGLSGVGGISEVVWPRAWFVSSC
jgi:hypothetical protein